MVAPSLSLASPAPAGPLTVAAWPVARSSAGSPSSCRLRRFSPAAVLRTGDGIDARILAAARRARDQALQQAAADRHAAAGCAHATASAAYQPPPRIREYVNARDQTCRNPRCGQPAWRADLDHTIPFDQGGLTCPCNLGALCRRHHQLKQRPGWSLAQPCPGMFQWTTPAGRTYTATPDLHYV